MDKLISSQDQRFTADSKELHTGYCDTEPQPDSKTSQGRWFLSVETPAEVRADRAVRTPGSPSLPQSHLSYLPELK